MIREILLVSITLSLFSACGIPYKNLQPIKADSLQVLEPYRFQPQFYGNSEVAYQASLSGKTKLKQFHFSGQLIFKELPGGGRNTEVSFSDNQGNSFFDFSWSIKTNGKDLFKVKSIASQINKRAIIKSLKTDFELFMVRDLENVKLFHQNDVTLYRSSLENGFAYFVVDDSSKTLQRIDVLDKKKLKSSIFQISKMNAEDFSDSLSFINKEAHLRMNGKKISTYSK